MGTTSRYQQKRSARRGRPSAPFDPQLSLRLDALILQLDAQPRGLRRAWLRFRKWNAERNVPIGLEVR